MGDFNIKVGKKQALGSRETLGIMQALWGHDVDLLYVNIVEDIYSGSKATWFSIKKAIKPK